MIGPELDALIRRIRSRDLEINSRYGVLARSQRPLMKWWNDHPFGAPVQEKTV